MNYPTIAPNLPSVTTVGPWDAELERGMQQLLSSAGGAAATAATYHLKSGGRRVRARLAWQAGIALGLTEADAMVIATVAECLHSASLRSEERRVGKEC